MSVQPAPGRVPMERHRDVNARPRLLVRLIEWYQRAYQGRPSPCRFTPSCSAYAHEALIVHGTWRGLALAVRRLARCRPFGPSGFDPVPEATASSAVPRTDP
jgi:uncharacterized protein